MINILINEPDNFYREGLALLLQELFLTEYGEEISLLQDMSPACIWNADVIILSLCQGESYTCKQEFRYRNRGIVIGLADTGSNRFRNFPSCYQDMVPVARASTSKHFYAAVVQAWNKRRRDSHYPPLYSCYNCNRQSLSRREYFIAGELLAGKSVADIARQLNLTDKSVYAQKYNLMKKYDLANSGELFTFLSHLNRKGFFDVAV